MRPVPGDCCAGTGRDDGAPDPVPAAFRAPLVETFPLFVFHPTPVALAACLAAASLANAAPAAPAEPPDCSVSAASAASAVQRPNDGAGLRAALRPSGAGLLLEADRLAGRTGAQMLADGAVEMTQGRLRVRAEHLEVHLDSHQLRATGAVQLERGDDLFSGPELEFNTESQRGHMARPRYLLARTQGRGQASRVDFLGPERVAVSDATYSTCRVDEGEEPPWVLQASEVRLDFEANEGIASGAVLRFYDVPILAAPVLSFPVNDQRKSGLLPPEISTSSAVGFEWGQPYYWNIAPNRDATLTPTLSTRRGAGLDTEFRYLEPRWAGETRLYVLQHDQNTGTRRWAARWQHAGELGDSGVTYGWQTLRVSDDDYWKHGLRGADSLTPRLLSSQAAMQKTRRYALGEDIELDQQLYARVQRWQTLQDIDPTARIESPYRRAPQMGVRWRASNHALEWTLQTEVNRFTHEDTSKPAGNRAHALASAAWQLGDSGWQLTPRLGINAASYAMDQPLADGRTQASRVIPTVSLESRWQLERETRWGEQAITQTLEPRLLYQQTPWRDQTGLPNFDSTGLDFNADTVFADNSFSGIDRVSDAHQVTGGVTTRFIDTRSGAELARLGITQRYLLADQRITPDGVPLTNRLSDLLLLGSTSAIRHWNLDLSLQYNPDVGKVSRSIAGVRYSPGPFRVLSTTYRMQHDTSEQLTLGWQWPLSGPGTRSRTPAAEAVEAGAALRLTPRAASSCSGTLYGVGRTDYSMRDRRLSSSLIGLEYDTGCWIGRIVAERKSTGASASTTKLMLQLELVGLSRIGFGSNPLSVLKDNIPGYQLLRPVPAPTVPALPTVSVP